MCQTYDSDTHKIQIIGNESIEADVFLYDTNGIIENSSTKLNADFTDITSGTYSILIQGKEWYAEGDVEI